MAKETISWLTTDFVLSQFAKKELEARQRYHEFCVEGNQEERRQEFYRGTFEGRILGDDQFSENALASAEEKFIPTLGVDQLISVVCKAYNIDEGTIVAPGKQQPGAEARAVMAYLSQDTEKLSLTELGKRLRRDISALSRAASRLRNRLNDDHVFAARLEKIKSELVRISKCQA